MILQQSRCIGHTKTSVIKRTFCQAFSPTPRIMPPSLISSKQKIPLNPLIYPGNILYLNNKKEVETQCCKLSEKEEILVVGFDMEWKPSFVKGVAQPKTALIQLCYLNKENTDYTCLLIHVVHTGLTPALQGILKSEEILKVGINITNDASKLQRDYGVQMGGVVELMSEARGRVIREGQTSGYRGKVDMQTLVSELLQKEIVKDKQLRTGNWERAVLNVEQQKYAATDAYASLLVYDSLLKCKLVKKEVKEDEGSISNGNKPDENDEKENVENDENNEKENVKNENEQESIEQNQCNKRQKLSNGTEELTAQIQQKNLNSEYPWESQVKAVEKLTFSKEEVYRQYMLEGKSFEEISKKKGIKTSTACAYFQDAIISGYQYSWSQLKISQTITQQIENQLSDLYPELVEIIREIESISSSKKEQGDQKTTADSESKLKQKIINLYGDKQNKDIIIFLREKKGFRLRDLRGETEIDYNDLKFQLLHWGRMLQWFISDEQ
eukprot:TRINITY_DN935_c0_g1_i8.p1 TRINITY_DN935_c0_g1~~TRINITY_DN935_c0_g1_i8.p1  ORF type:complete len:519 (-),score=83.67 TRINITY_DN935_c0_g1_i8:152-1645(-)